MKRKIRFFRLALPMVASFGYAAHFAMGEEAPATNSPVATDAHVATANLLRQFNQSAWAAQKAHDQAVQTGAALLPDLIAAASERPRPGYARMWLATAIADIPDAQSATALLALLDDPDVNIGCVAGYYGPKQNNATLDQAIGAKAASLHNARFTSYALLGFLTFRGEAPKGLLQAGLESNDPRARAAAVHALAGMASEQSQTRLQALLQDKDERVRAAARQVLDAMQPAKKEPSGGG
jgi:HEAT repeat protein